MAQGHATSGTSPTRVEPRGPVFISYRQSDGKPLAVSMAWALRAAGIPVWHDQTDLPPGDTRRRLDEALSSGLSGALLLVTPEIALSAVVRDVELPRLLELEADSSFTLSLASTIEAETGHLDYAAADQLLGQAEGTLQRFEQQSIATPEDRARIAAALCRRRMEQLRPEVEAAGKLLTLDVQSRVLPSAGGSDAHLVLRLRPPVDGERRPHVEGLEDLRRFLGQLPKLVALAGADGVLVRGGAHLSIACALGAALPTTLIGRLEVIDTRGDTWSTHGQPPAPGAERLLGTVTPPWSTFSRGPVLAYVDLLPQRSDGAVEALLEAGRGFAGHLHLRPLGEDLLHPEDAAAIVGEISSAIRSLADAHRTTEVHLLLRSPYPLAVLVGRSLNTLTVHLYEWEDGTGPDGLAGTPRYFPSFILRSGAGGSPIQAVTGPALVTMPPE